MRHGHQASYNQSARTAPVGTHHERHTLRLPAATSTANASAVITTCSPASSIRTINSSTPER